VTLFMTTRPNQPRTSRPHALFQRTPEQPAASGENGPAAEDGKQQPALAVAVKAERTDQTAAAKAPASHSRFSFTNSVKQAASSSTDGGSSAEVATPQYKLVHSYSPTLADSCWADKSISNTADKQLPKVTTGLMSNG
jgi:hypothetical protein